MTSPTESVARNVGLREATRVWAYIGLNSFGGPAGQIAVMHREVVERRKWVSEDRFLHALNYCMVLPGPEAQQLATYIGWLMHGVRGGAIAGILFVLPGFFAMLALAAGYAVFGGVSWVAGLLFGIQAAVVAIVAEAVLRIGRRTLRTPALRLIAAASFLAIFFFAVPFPLIVIGAGLIGFLVGGQNGNETNTTVATDERVDQRKGRSALLAALACAVLWLVPVVALVLILGTHNVFAQESILFSKSAVVTFGGAYAVLGYVAQQAVSNYGWVSPGDMITGLGLAESTPGPLIMVVEFFGFLAAYHNPGSLHPLVAGTLGAMITVWVTFVPCFLFIFAGAPYVERLRDNVGLKHALTAIGAAVAGVVLNLAVWFAVHTVFGIVDDVRTGPLHLLSPHWSTVRWASLGISAGAAVLVFRLKLGTLKVLGLAAATGAVLSLAGLT